jgi:hypothetical protein
MVGIMPTVVVNPRMLLQKLGELAELPEGDAAVYSALGGLLQSAANLCMLANGGHANGGNVSSGDACA